MIKPAEVDAVVDRLFKCEEGQNVEFGEVAWVTQNWLRRFVEYNDVKKVFDAYYKRVDKEEEKHAKEVFNDLKKSVRDGQDDELKEQLGL